MAWTTLYTFTELEFFQRDIDAGSYVVSTLPGTIFYSSIVANKRFRVPLEEDCDASRKQGSEDLVWIGKWTMDGSRITKRIGARILEEEILTPESRRVEVLRDVFGVNVTPGDERWIIGREATLTASSS